MRPFLLLALLSISFGQTPVEWPAVRPVLVAAGFAFPTTIASARDGSGRLFIAEQAGRIQILRAGRIAPVPFLDISDRVNCCGERGLLGLAFPPSFAAKRHFYVYYTAASGDLVISRFELSSNPDIADPSSETVILQIEHREFSNHNGGNLVFGPRDGYLYLGTGDGGGGGDSLLSSQNPGVLLGKLLRIDVESGESPYSIPPGNPFAGKAGARPEVWAWGLRNPWRFSFDRLTGDLYIGDVGQEMWEEVDFQPASSPGGENYGWNPMEGNHCFLEPDCSTEGLTLPVAEHSHAEGCTVVGGYVYRGTRFPALQGFYIYGDYCNGRAWMLRKEGDVWRKSPPFETGIGISTFGEDEEGNLYVADHGEGRIFELRP
ncbi:MAG TPA: PQQ-dependent sugar dehydrogenase [Bryobacteraceae bacterium]|nr:PQQ-dependent sugar dehydrogenase [Bryobacteraceae bacterium]